MSDWKPTNNPKDSLGSVKAPIHLVPRSLEVAASMAFLEGREKYGQFNWRITGVRASIYYAALRRHIDAWWDGEDIDPDTCALNEDGTPDLTTGLHHLWKAAACIAILIDAMELDVLADDRPPKAPTAELMARTKELGEAIRERLEDFAPYQYTEANRHDGPQTDPGPIPRTLKDLPEPMGQSIMEEELRQIRRGVRGVSGSSYPESQPDPIAINHHLPIPCPDCGARSTFVDRIPGTEYDVTYRCPTHKEFELVVIGGQYAVQR